MRRTRKRSLPGEFEGKGANDERVEKVSKVTGGRHVTRKDGLVVAKERSAYLEEARNEHQKSWDSTRKSVVPESKKRKK